MILPVGGIGSAADAMPVPSWADLLGQEAIDDDRVRGDGRAAARPRSSAWSSTGVAGLVDEQRDARGLDRGQDPDAGPERLDDRVVDSRRRRPIPIGLRAQVADDRQGGRASSSGRMLDDYHRAVTSTPRPGGLAGLTPSGRAVVPAAWSLYDFANTIFSFAVVSGAIGLYLVNDRQFGERDGNAAAVGRDRRQRRAQRRWSRRSSARSRIAAAGGCRSCCSSRSCASARPSSSPTCRRSLGLALFIVANFAYQAALIYYDATLKTVSYPETRGKLSGIGTAIGYCGTVFVGLLIFFLDIAGRRPVPADGDPVPASSRSRSSGSSASRAGPTSSR